MRKFGDLSIGSKCFIQLGERVILLEKKSLSSAYTLNYNGERQHLVGIYKPVLGCAKSVPVWEVR